ncbi:MAG: translation initiation factor IF-3 [Candidatus Binatia bacterium]
MAKEERVRINSDIRAREMRLIDTDGTQLGILSSGEAMAIAEERGLDLVEVAGNADPPVCRIMDFHKYRYERKKKVQDSKRKSTATAMKEVKIRSRTEAHDIEFKTGHIVRFLEKGHRVKISVFFKGREITRPELGRGMLDKVLASIADVASPEGEPRMEGRHMSVVVIPSKS